MAPMFLDKHDYEVEKNLLNGVKQVVLCYMDKKSLGIEPTHQLVKDLDGIVASCCTNVKDWEKIWYISKDRDEILK
ncbi:hypothetical protein DAPPUDRAFT_250622 [Daphnia pulex]|uniref:Uncharacterized protein n=1 Tax=Daphnia pulex TaxID=6669 RepID=E9GYZ4_DAPPU|nr:hypothetical protein DAPPUDRAFT_250622 [Daphnia pulex]|eukprot:EFX75320.1 hypothetical protein DAPPUDRAFT_250622 [Daphnia pulex]